MERVAIGDGVCQLNLAHSTTELINKGEKSNGRLGSQPRPPPSPLPPYHQKQQMDNYGPPPQQQMQQQMQHQGQGQGPNQQQDPSHLATISRVIAKLLVSNSAAGAVIGRGGGAIGALQAASGARLQLSRAREYFPGTQDRVLLIAGSMEAVLTALHLVLQKLAAERVRGSFRVFCSFVFSFFSSSSFSNFS